MDSGVGVVVIGRNEGDRLVRCLVSMLDKAEKIVYVDSGSTDDSVSIALGLGVEVVQLDITKPFTAARARNEGFFCLMRLQLGISYVQFVDGDCVVADGWLSTARAFLDAHVEVAVVCGRRRERFPEQSIYNLLCDMEWDSPVGEAKSCGGDALVRVDAFAAVGGYRADLIAGEEPELCVRLRAAGWKVWRVGEEMTLHDAAIFRFGQWWRRAMRGGFAFAEGAYLHGAPPERHRVSESRRAWLWGLGVPVAVIVAMLILGYAGALILLVYPAQVIRLALKRSWSQRQSWLMAFFMTLGKFPEVQGQVKYLLQKIGPVRAALIEYK